jgi:hypothetical protein
MDSPGPPGARSVTTTHAEMVVPTYRDGQNMSIGRNDSDSVVLRDDPTDPRQRTPEPGAQPRNSSGESRSRREQELVVLTTCQRQTEVPTPSSPIHGGKWKTRSLDDGTDSACRAQVAEVFQETVAHIEHAADEPRTTEGPANTHARGRYQEATDGRALFAASTKLQHAQRGEAECAGHVQLVSHAAPTAGDVAVRSSSQQCHRQRQLWGSTRVAADEDYTVASCSATEPSVHVLEISHWKHRWSTEIDERIDWAATHRGDVTGVYGEGLLAELTRGAPPAVEVYPLDEDVCSHEDRRIELDNGCVVTKAAQHPPPAPRLAHEACYPAELSNISQARSQS